MSKYDLKEQSFKHIASGREKIKEERKKKEGKRVL